jgi:hypothetical protein
MRLAYKLITEKRLVMIYSPIFGVHYEVRNVVIDEEEQDEEITE